MPCYRPLEAWQTIEGEVVFKKGQGQHHYDIKRPLNLPCGQCVGCRLERSRQWAVRCTHEKQFHEEAAFLTLTYSDDDLPDAGSLLHYDVQCFMKKLRRHVVRHLPKCKIPTAKKSGRVSVLKQNANGLRWNLEVKFKRREKKLNVNYLRYYMCGEYGEKTRRAHYHMCLYGWTPKDQTYYTTSGSKIKSKIFTSKTLDKIWGKGHCYIGDITFESAAYVARYILKKVNGPRAEQHYEIIDGDTGEILKRQPEYTRMSLKPGIGSSWIEKFASDAYPAGTVLARGHKSKTPKYYDKKYKQLDPLGYEDLLFEREKEGKKNELDNTPERLAVKEHVQRAAIAFLKRNAH